MRLYATVMMIVLFSSAIGCSKPDPVVVPVDISAVVKPSQDEHLENLRQESVFQEAKPKELAEQVELQKAKDLEEQLAKLQAENEAQRLKLSQEANEARAMHAKRLQREKLIKIRMDEIFAYQKSEFKTRVSAAVDLLKEGKQITTADRELIQQMNTVVAKLVDKVQFDDSDRQFLTEIGLEWWGTPEATIMYAGFRSIEYDQLTAHAFIRDVKMVSKAFGYSWDETAAYGEWYLRQLRDPYSHNPNTMISIIECIKAERDITHLVDGSKGNPFVTDMVQQYLERMRTPEFAALVAKNEVDFRKKKRESIKAEKIARSKKLSNLSTKIKPLEIQIDRIQNADSQRVLQKLEELQVQLNKLTDERDIEIAAIKRLDLDLEELTLK